MHTTHIPKGRFLEVDTSRRHAPHATPASVRLRNSVCTKTLRQLGTLGERAAQQHVQQYIYRTREHACPTIRRRPNLTQAVPPSLMARMCAGARKKSTVPHMLGKSTEIHAPRLPPPSALRDVPASSISNTHVSSIAKPRGRVACSSQEYQHKLLHAEKVASQRQVAMRRAVAQDVQNQGRVQWSMHLSDRSDDVPDTSHVDWEAVARARTWVVHVPDLFTPEERDVSRPDPPTMPWCYAREGSLQRVMLCSSHWLAQRLQRVGFHFVYATERQVRRSALRFSHPCDVLGRDLGEAWIKRCRVWAHEHYTKVKNIGAWMKRHMDTFASEHARALCKKWAREQSDQHAKQPEVVQSKRRVEQWQALQQFEIDRIHSVVEGDEESAIQCAQGTGVPHIITSDAVNTLLSTHRHDAHDGHRRRGAPLSASLPKTTPRHSHTTLDQDPFYMLQ